MTRTSRLLGATSALAFVALGAAPALADGTDAGTAIQNSVTVSFDVGGVAQSPVTSNTDEFLVDRKVDLTVAESGGTATVVTPGSTQQVTSFQVTNLSNDTLDFQLTVAQQDGGTAAFTGTDTFNTIGTTLIYVDTDGDGDWTDETATTYIDELAADETRTVFVVTDIPLGVVTDDVATVNLTADAYSGGGAGSLGTELTTSATNTKDAVDTVLADGENPDAPDGLNNGSYSARDDYLVTAAALSVVKTSSIVSDPVSGTTNPKAIPGATVEYCILVTNNGSASATNVIVSDDVPAEVTRDGGFGVVLQDSCSDTANPASGSFADPGANGKGTATGNLGSIAASDTRALLFRAVID